MDNYRDDRRTDIVDFPLPVQGDPTHPDLHHVYLDLEQGTWGDRSSIVILTLTDSELEDFAQLADSGRRKVWEGANRYFGETYGAGIRRHLSIADKPNDPTLFD